MKRPSITAQMKLDALRMCVATFVCPTCKRTTPVGAAQFDHHLALVDGGAHATSNLRPICIECHKIKSAREHIENSRSKRLATARAAHESIVKKVAEKAPGKIKNRGFDKTKTKKFSGEVVRRS